MLQNLMEGQEGDIYTTAIHDTMFASYVSVSDLL